MTTCYSLRLLELNSNGAATRALPVALFRISNLASDIGGGDLRAILRTLYHSLVETVVNFDSCLNDFFPWVRLPPKFQIANRVEIT